MAEGIMRYEWENLGLSNLNTSSMGIHGLDQQPASKHSQDICLESGVDISSHRSRKLIIPELESAHLIFSMERVQKEFIRTFFPKLNDKSFLLAVWPEEDSGKKAKKGNIRDPYGGSLREYKEAFKIINGHIKRIVPIIKDLYC